MGDATPAYPESLTPELIAPCGMDCGICIGHLRNRKACPGCNDPDDSSKPYHCVACSIKHCEHHAQGSEAFCVNCAKYPCARLRQLDRRYRSKYRMSMMENLVELRSVGMEMFIELERLRWACPHCGALVSVHRTACLSCGESVEETRGAGLNRRPS